MAALQLFRGPQLDAIEARTLRQDITDDHQLIVFCRQLVFSQVFFRRFNGGVGIVRKIKTDREHPPGNR